MIIATIVVVMVMIMAVIMVMIMAMIMVRISPGRRTNDKTSSSCDSFHGST